LKIGLLFFYILISNVNSPDWSSGENSQNKNPGSGSALRLMRIQNTGFRGSVQKTDYFYIENSAWLMRKTVPALSWLKRDFWMSWLPPSSSAIPNSITSAIKKNNNKIFQVLFTFQVQFTSIIHLQKLFGKLADQWTVLHDGVVQYGTCFLLPSFTKIGYINNSITNY